MSGSRAVWKEVLAVYSVKVNTDPDNPQEVATMDESKKQLLTDIFWEMNEISSSTDSKTETVITETDDGHGNIVETESTVTQTYLYITVSHKTADEMAAQYGFNEEQKEYLAELLADENNSLWSQVLYGITGTDDQIQPLPSVLKPLYAVDAACVFRNYTSVNIPAFISAPRNLHGRGQLRGFCSSE